MIESDCARLFLSQKKGKSCYYIAVFAITYISRDNRDSMGDHADDDQVR
jgi:hypothetical protein